MYKTIAITFLLLLSTSAYAQTTDERRTEVFIGYSNLQAEGVPGEDGGDSFDDEVFGERTGVHGFNASFAGYLSERFGLKGDFSYNQKRNRFSAIGNTIDGRLDTRVMYLMGGPTMRFKNSSRVTPFVHAMAGIANTRFEVETRRTGTIGNTSSQFTTNATDFAAAIGGGVDVRVSDRFSLRLIQVDYAPVFLRDRSINALDQAGAIQRFTLEGQRQDNIRIGIGIVIH